MWTRRTYPRRSARIPLWVALVASLVGAPAMVYLMAAVTPAAPEVSEELRAPCGVEQVEIELGRGPGAPQPNRSI